MCTVTFIPLTKETFILTSNRDETPKRSAGGISQVDRAGKRLLFPRDPKANGTWIAASDSNQLICVLNGAFQKHQHRPPYRLSRGIMALDFFSYPNATAFFNTFDFTGIEPFTMIIHDNGQLFELRWDEQQSHVKELAVTEKHIWSSCTLYPDEWQEKRRTWFANWQAEKSEMNQSAILDFHKNGGEGNSEYDIVMNRWGLVQTTSITSVWKKSEAVEMRYEDLLTGAVDRDQIALQLVD